MTTQHFPLFIGLSTALAASMIASLHLGLRPISPSDVWSALNGSESIEALVVAQLRVPRTLIAAAAGASLALSGVFMQAATRNPLAEPGILGVNAGAAFAVTLGSTVSGVGSLWHIGALAASGAVASTAIVFGLALSIDRTAGSATVLLAGVTVAALFAAMTQMLLLIDEAALETLLFWLAGGFADRPLELLSVGLFGLGVGTTVAFVLGAALDALRLDDATAATLGVPVARVRWSALLTAALLAAGAVTMAGPVAFLGLVAPHMARRMATGGRFFTIAPLAIVLGALLAVVADIFARTVVAPGESPISAVMALAGAPVLIMMLRRKVPVA